MILVPGQVMQDFCEIKEVLTLEKLPAGWHLIAIVEKSQVEKHYKGYPSPNQNYGTITCEEPCIVDFPVYVIGRKESAIIDEWENTKKELFALRKAFTDKVDELVKVTNTHQVLSDTNVILERNCNTMRDDRNAHAARILVLERDIAKIRVAMGEVKMKEILFGKEIG